jgi:hypothetical protein
VAYKTKNNYICGSFCVIFEVGRMLQDTGFVRHFSKSGYFMGHSWDTRGQKQGNIDKYYVNALLAKSLKSSKLCYCGLFHFIPSKDC